jgi:hypothetical protein
VRKQIPAENFRKNVPPKISIKLFPPKLPPKIYSLFLFIFYLKEITETHQCDQMSFQKITQSVAKPFFLSKLMLNLCRGKKETPKIPK